MNRRAAWGCLVWLLFVARRRFQRIVSYRIVPFRVVSCGFVVSFRFDSSRFESGAWSRAHLNLLQQVPPPGLVHSLLRSGLYS